MCRHVSLYKGRDKNINFHVYQKFWLNSYQTHGGVLAAASSTLIGCAARGRRRARAGLRTCLEGGRALVWTVADIIRLEGDREGLHDPKERHKGGSDVWSVETRDDAVVRPLTMARITGTNTSRSIWILGGSTIYIAGCSTYSLGLPCSSLLIASGFGDVNGDGRNFGNA